MREARIILPHRDNDGLDVSGAHQDLKLALIRQFGGYTTFNVWGGWRHPTTGAIVEDESAAYDVAVPDNAVDGLRRLAFQAGKTAHQDAVYLRLPTGEVEFIAIDEALPKAA